MNENQTKTLYIVQCTWCMQCGSAQNDCNRDSKCGSFCLGLYWRTLLPLEPNCFSHLHWWTELVVIMMMMLVIMNVMRTKEKKVTKVMNGNMHYAGQAELLYMMTIMALTLFYFYRSHHHQYHLTI